MTVARWTKVDAIGCIRRRSCTCEPIPIPIPIPILILILILTCSSKVRAYVLVVDRNKMIHRRLWCETTGTGIADTGIVFGTRIDMGIVIDIVIDIDNTKIDAVFSVGLADTAYPALEIYDLVRGGLEGFGNVGGFCDRAKEPGGHLEQSTGNVREGDDRRQDRYGQLGSPGGGGLADVVVVVNLVEGQISGAHDVLHFAVDL
mmetsp:Transcript_5295/g.12342  ORF Transcript_5295/g.12342 Transcript_5295/m.12342 type:complete len:203 (-) Transcript_5295:293-901(-)